MPELVSVLANGPSLKTARPFGVTVAANFAGLTCREFDWLAFGDAWLTDTIAVSKTLRQPRKGYFVRDDCLSRTRRISGLRPVIPWSCLSFAEAPVCTAHMAIHFAADVLGAHMIHLFGFDMLGDTYADGTKADHSELRWPRERKALDALMSSFAAQGIEVIRH